MIHFLCSGKIIADKDCCICHNTKCKKGGGYEALAKCLTKTAALKLQSCADSRNDNPRLRAYVTGIDWGNIVALELYYHISCYKLYTKPVKDVVQPANDGPLNTLTDLVHDRVIVNKEVIESDVLLDMYKNLGPARIPDKRVLLDQILMLFNATVGLWTPKYGCSFLYNSLLEKGEIIQMYRNEKENSKEKPMSLEDKIVEVGQQIRKSIQSMSPTFPQWPVDEDSLLDNTTTVPEPLRCLVTSIVSNRRFVCLYIYFILCIYPNKAFSIAQYADFGKATNSHIFLNLYSSN